MVIHSVPKSIQLLFPKRKWREEGAEGSVFLTFDDGPVPGVTDYVLNELSKRGQKASFFMVGDNVQKHPTLAREVLEAGHRIGNHTFHHLNGFKNSTQVYYENFLKTETTLEDTLGIHTTLFRPPYGLIRPSQVNLIRKTHQIIMWDVLSGDYSKSIAPEKVLENSKKRTKGGSIVVFHDQQKTLEVLPKVLPMYLDSLLGQGFKTELL
jgi:peptidoglycan-N-acetylglucosamine deacetylase